MPSCSPRGSASARRVGGGLQAAGGAVAVVVGAQRWRGWGRRRQGSLTGQPLLTCTPWPSPAPLPAAPPQQYKQRKRLGGGREKATLARLAAFQAGLKGGAAAGGEPPPPPQQQAERQQQGAAEGAAEGKAEGAAEPKEGEAGYSGRVRGDIDHRAYMPGTWGQAGCMARSAPAPAAAARPLLRGAPRSAMPPTQLTPPLHMPPLRPAAAWRVDDYLGGGGSDDDLDLASLRAHRLAFAKDRKDAMSRRCHPRGRAAPRCVLRACCLFWLELERAGLGSVPC